MTLLRLKEQISFEAGIPDMDALNGWLDLTIQEVFDQHTAQFKFDELYMDDILTTLVGAFTGLVTLPSDLQHLDIENIRYQSGGDATHEVIIPYKKDTYSYLSTANDICACMLATNGTQLKFYPEAAWPNVLDGSKFLINYWRKVDCSTDATILVPDHLVHPVKLEVMARAAAINSTEKMKTLLPFASIAKSRSMGVPPLSSQND